MLGRIAAVAQNTLREVLTHRLFQVILVLWVFLFLAIVLGQVGSGKILESHLSHYLVAMLSFLSFFGTLLAVVLPPQIFFSDLEHRTLLTLLSKPIARWEILWGKFWALAIALFAFSCVNFLLIAAVAFYYRGQIENPDVFRLDVLACVAGFSCLKNCLVIALALAICSLCQSSISAILCTTLAVGFSQFQDLFQSFIVQLESSWLRHLLKLVDAFFPDLSRIELSASLIFETAWPLDGFLGGDRVLYAVLYILFFNLIALGIFQKRKVE